MPESTIDLNSVIAALRVELEVVKEVTAALEKVEQVRLRRRAEATATTAEADSDRSRRKSTAAAPSD